MVPRSLCSTITKFKKAAPIAIGFDILFLDSSPKDPEFAAAIKASGNVVLAKAGNEENLAPEIKDSARFEGDISHESDTDGVSRLAYIWLDRTPSLSLALIQVYHSKNTNNFPRRMGGLGQAQLFCTRSQMVMQRF
ncbi:hypothetical protein BCD67_05060 [Oscillatoriales cyanobacterium USR001]|nr:hypothetical protein BCD67_05060 [Oscillatoriales cyanobacterium USR001]